MSCRIEVRSGLGEIGGGRGVFVVDAVPAGSLLLTEVALVAVPLDKEEEVRCPDPWGKVTAAPLIQY